MKTYNYLFLSLVLSLICCFDAAAQNTSSPYSMYGYGLLRDGATATQRQMGGIGYAMRANRQINAMNPASYASIDSLTFLWDIGADLSFNHRSETLNGVKNSANGKGGGLDYLQMQFPVGKCFGASVGLIPYSSVGYTFGDEVVHGSLSNQGTGGITQAYAGFSGRWKGLSLGVNVSYDFGNVINDVYAYVGSNQTLFEHVMQVRDWNLTVGAQYTFIPARFNRVTIGAVYTPKKSLHGTTYIDYWDITADSKADTVAYAKMNGKYYRPTTIGGGISWQRDRSSHIMVEADVEWQQWSKAKFSALYGEDGAEVLAPQQFNDRMRLALGGEYTHRVRGNYFQRLTWRLGGHYTRDYLVIAGNDVKDFGLSCGVGIPTIEGKTIVNVGFEWLHRRAYPQALISENYFNITVGLNFNELWFWQRKIK